MKTQRFRHATRFSFTVLLYTTIWIALSVRFANGQSSGAISSPQAESQPVQRDPTIPSPEIQRRARSPLPTALPPSDLPARFPGIPRSADSDAIELQSLIQSSVDACTATLRAGQQSVTISFVRDKAQREIQLPATQFADFASTVQRLSAELRSLRAQAILADDLSLNQDVAPAESSNLDTPDSSESDKIAAAQGAMRQAAAAAEAEMLEVEREFMRQALQPQRVDLTSSFTLGGNLYRVIDFTDDTLLLEQVPLGKYVIVR